MVREDEVSVQDCAAEVVAVVYLRGFITGALLAFFVCAALVLVWRRG